MAIGGQNQSSIKPGGTEESKGIKEWAKRRLASVGPPEAHLAAHLCVTQWLRGGWPPWGLQRPSGGSLVLCLSGGHLHYYAEP